MKLSQMVTNFTAPEYSQAVNSGMKHDELMNYSELL